ncbi:hypothetical protein A2U01_0083710, partial [Trifolium medium]|nr:hypothetical protein [Trifolium medium]
DEMANVDEVIEVESFSRLWVGEGEAEEVPEDGDVDEDDDDRGEDEGQDDDENLSDWDDNN